MLRVSRSTPQRWIPPFSRYVVRSIDRCSTAFVVQFGSKLFLSTTAAVHSGSDGSTRRKTRLLFCVARRKCVAVFGGAGVYALLSVCFMLASEQLPRFQSASASLAQHVVGMWVAVNLVTSIVYYTFAQAAPSMIYLPPDTVKEKVAALRSCLPGVNLYNFLKGMPTALGRSKETVPRGITQLKEVSHPTPCGSA